MSWVVTELVPKMLNFDQKQHRANIAQWYLDMVRNDPNVFQRVINGDKSWVYGYDIEIKAQWSQWDEPKQKRAKFDQL